MSTPHLTPFPVHTVDSAPVGSRELLRSAEQAWGFLPKLHAVLAESPAALEAYMTLFRLVGESSLSAQQQQVAYLTVSALHGCRYCVAGHTYLAQQAGLPSAVVQALRRGEPITTDDRLEALRRFVTRLVLDRGQVAPEEVAAFHAAGHTRQNLLELITLVATKTISNYANHLALTPAEAFMADPSYGWTPAQMGTGATTTAALA